MRVFGSQRIMDMINILAMSSNDTTDLFSIIKERDWDGAISHAQGGYHRGNAGFGIWNRISLSVTGGGF